MWFDSKYRIRRKTESYSRVKNALKTPQNFNTIIPISNLKKTMSHVINGLNEIPSITYPEMKKVILGIIRDILEASNFIGWVKVLNTKHKFKFIARFFSNLDYYHGIKCGVDKNKEMLVKIQELHFPIELEKALIKYNRIRNKCIHHEYELNREDKERIVELYFQFLIAFFEREIKPIVESMQRIQRLSLKEYFNLVAEIKFYIHNYFENGFPNNIRYRQRILVILDNLCQ
ncbi:MAG: hypothetical protein ACFFDN_11020 [Candidatus Hodarchaeota archaeon]